MTDQNDPLHTEPNPPEHTNPTEPALPAEKPNADAAIQNTDSVSQEARDTEPENAIGAPEKKPEGDPAEPKEEPKPKPEPKPELPEADPGRQEVGAPAPKQTDAPYAYRWSYEAQAVYDQQERKKRRGRGAGVYAAVMTVAFLLCIGVLIAVLALNATGKRVALSTAEIAEEVNPGTVLIYSANSSNYGYGTGFFVRSDGYLLTNYHVVQGADEIAVTLYSGAEREARVVWSSEQDDLAILKIEGNNYPALRIGNSDNLQIGDLAVAIGNPAGAVCPWTTTQGIVSAVNRRIAVEENGKILELTMIQTDALVNPGNSGGPLCNDRGEVIGIVTRKMTDYEGVGLAIPINGAMELVNAYLNTGSTKNVVSSVSKVRPALGVQVENVKKGDRITGSAETAPCDGVRVTGVTANSASSGILQVGDIITKINGKSVTTMDELRSALYQYRAGDTVRLTVARNGELISVDVKLAAATATG